MSFCIISSNCFNFFIGNWGIGITSTWHTWLNVKRNAKKMYLEHFCLLIPAEWSAVNTSSHSEAFKRILMIFLINKPAAWLFYLTRYWFPRRRFLVKSSIPKVAVKSLNIFEKFQVLVKLQAYRKLSPFLRFLSRLSKMELCGGNSPSLKLVSASFFRIFIFHQW